MLALGVTAGCESEAIRPSFDRSNAGAPSDNAGAPASGDAGAAGGPSDAEGGATSAGGAPNGSAGNPANEAGEGGRHVSGEAGANAGGENTAGGDASGGESSAGTSSVDPPGDSGAGGTPPSGGSGGAPPEPEPNFPCDVRVVLESKCQRCHQDPPLNGAPFPLLSWSDTRVEYVDQLVYQAMLGAVDTDFMPPLWVDVEPPVQALTAGEKQTLLDWLESDAPPADEPVSCE